MGKKLEEHLKLVEAAKRKNVLCVAELHKRFDPIYTDARDRIKNMGPFSYYFAYMSQPKHQLETFKAWGQELRHFLLPQFPPHRLPRVVHARKGPSGASHCAFQHGRREQEVGRDRDRGYHHP